MREVNDFDEFYRVNAARLVTQVYLMTGNLSEAEDAVQEACARAWRQWGRVRELAEPAAWVRVVAYRIAVSSWRRARNRLAAHLLSRPPATLPELSPDTVVLLSALRRIPAAQSRAIVLHHLAGLTVREIATETGASESAVKAQLSRGRRALAPLLQIDDETHTPQVEAHHA